MSSLPPARRHHFRVPRRADNSLVVRPLRHVSALLLAGVVGVLVALTAPGAAAAAPGCRLSQMSSTSQPACWKPFTASSPFNSQLPSSPTLASGSAAEINHMVSAGWSLDGSDN